MSFLVMDIGNTRLKWGVYSEPRPGAEYLAGGAVVLEEIDHLARDQWADLSHPQQMLGCAVAGDGVKRRVEEQLEIWRLKPQWVSSQAQAAGVINRYEHPSRLGADRWAAIVGARHRVLAHVRASGQEPRPAVVVMVGTAVTVDAIDAQGRFLGGLILPGFGLMLKALELGTAGLKVPSGEVRDFPRNTSDALMSGGAEAIAGAVERMVARMARQFGSQPHLLMSGGAAPKLAPSIEQPLEVVEHLIFEGLLQLALAPEQ
ncbi:type III pantothenate kinase [Aquabacterium sp.]|uniref:type III pantothenate kinase n=1 Tax=Aquabacterium sp. TaxID=1872578 RepID=UPI0035B3AB11